ncbi:MAG: peptidoglycan-binding protein [Colwellia sp.]|nr:peptidoglycan-binding protein [Colwellia sp.]
MAFVSRSSIEVANKNRLIYHKLTVYLQRFPGENGDDASRSITNTPEYKVYLDGTFSQSGNIAADGGIDVLIPGGAKAILECLGTEYELQPLQIMEPHDTLKGVHRRLQLLGYYEDDVNDKWGTRTDAAVLDFQADHGLDPNGNALEAVTIDKIKEVFGE